VTISAVNNRAFGPYLWMLGGAFGIAWMGQFASLLSDRCDWRIVALARAVLAFAFALMLARLSGAKLVLWRPAALWVRGCASSISLLCTFFALAQLPTSEVQTLTNTVPIWVALLSWPILRVRPSLSVWLAAGCGVLGVALIQYAPHHSALNIKTTLAIILSLTAAFTNAIAMLGLNRLGDVHPWAVVVHYSGVATLFVLGALLVSVLGGAPPALAPLREGPTLMLLLATGVAATVGQVCVTQAYAAGQPAQVAVVGLTVVVFALGLNLLFPGPSISPTALAGIGLVLAPTAWVMIGKAAH
jgi:drug/metabolite transporter (DMT)-like permease